MAVTRRRFFKTLTGATMTYMTCAPKTAIFKPDTRTVNLANEAVAAFIAAIWFSDPAP